ncbi:uncharacterized protein LOC142101559 [Mixophyes fleayi]|uniref:uncharacterized protein LOC142101559 n=1 Tax=Mixophyes fleayi TaxID=3061075 RepID=UPI003F4DC24F
MTFINKQKIISQLSNVPNPNVPPTIIWGNEVLRPVCVVSSTSMTVLPTDSNKTIHSATSDSFGQNSFLAPNNCLVGKPRMSRTVNNPAPTLLMSGSLHPSTIIVPAESPGMRHHLQTVLASATPTLMPGLTQVTAADKTWLIPSAVNVPAQSCKNWITGKPEINFNLPVGNFPAPTVMSGSLGSSQRPEVPFPVMPGTGPNTFSMGSSSTNTVHEHFKRWQKYNNLVRRYVPCFPDTEVLSCFMIPVLRSLSRLRPDMKIKEGVQYTLNKWLKTTKADRKIYYQIAKTFIEEEEAENLQRSHQQMVEADKAYDINMGTEGSLEAGVDEETTAKSEAAEQLDTYKEDNAKPESDEQTDINAEITAMTAAAVHKDIYEEQITETDNEVEVIINIDINTNSESPVEAIIKEKSTVHTKRRVRAVDTWKLKSKRRNLCNERQKKLLKRHLYRHNGKISPGYMETVTSPRNVKLPKSEEGRPSEDSPDTELLHYIETLCDQPEFLSQVKYLL